MKTFAILALVCLVGGVMCEDESTPDPELTPCQSAREHALKTKSEVNLVPECDEQGNYKPFQCYTSGKPCICMDDEGHPMTPASFNLKTCVCHLKRRENRLLGGILVGKPLPKCRPDGYFEKKQCLLGVHSKCWCVDEKTGERTTDLNPHDEVSC